MQIPDDLKNLADWEGDEESSELTATQIIAQLQAMEKCMTGDPCLKDLAGYVTKLRTEFEERRMLALQVADEIDAENCRLLN